MNSIECIESGLIDPNKVSHGFGLGKYVLVDYLLALEMKHAVFFRTNQMHGDTIVKLTRDTPKEPVIEADAFVTNEKGVVAYVRTADCVPILLSDPVNNVVAAVHAGWRGTSAHIVRKTLEFMVREFGTRVADVCAAIGPAVGLNCYEVGADVVSRLNSPDKFVIQKDNGKFLADLKKINSAQLSSCGVSKIDLIDICTHCDMRFASYRRERSDTKRQVSFITLK